MLEPLIERPESASFSDAPPSGDAQPPTCSANSAPPPMPARVPAPLARRPTQRLSMPVCSSQSACRDDAMLPDAVNEHRLGMPRLSMLRSRMRAASWLVTDGSPRERRVETIVEVPPNIEELRQLHHALNVHEMASNRPNLVALVALLLYTSIGGIYFKAALDVTWIQGFYLAVSTVTTVCYGDFTPRQAHEDSTVRLVLGLLYILFGLLVVGGCLVRARALKLAGSRHPGAPMERGGPAAARTA